MTFSVHTKFPKEDVENGTKQSTTSHSEKEFGLEFNDVIDLYNQYERSGYKVSTNFKAQGQADPVTIASNLTNNGIDYKASLKFIENSNKGSYEYVKPISQIVFQQGFDFDVAAVLKINDESSIDFDREATWFSDDAQYQVKPKASSSDVADLIPIYERLTDAGYAVTIDIKPKASDDFATQFSAYPDETEIVFTLKNSEY